MGLAIYITIDDSDLQSKLLALKAALQPGKVEQAMHRVMKRIPSRARMILKQDIPHYYFASPGDIGAAVKAAQISGMSCTIPIAQSRKSIGGGFGASGGAHGWASLHRKYSIKARIVKASASVLPAKMKGGQPPFRNLSCGGLTFTRMSKARIPILKVMGIAIPQMPTNRAEGDVQADLMEYIMQLVDHELSFLISGGG